MDVGLVSCTKQKRDDQARPAELYTPSTYFSKASSYAQRTHDDWYILSAEHGLLRPEGSPIDPYDTTLADFSAEEKQEWAENVVSDLISLVPNSETTTVVSHAGKLYNEPLLPLMEKAELDYQIPTEGLRFGETLHWYSERDLENSE